MQQQDTDSCKPICVIQYLKIPRSTVCVDFRHHQKSYFLDWMASRWSFDMNELWLPVKLRITCRLLCNMLLSNMLLSNMPQHKSNQRSQHTFSPSYSGFPCMAIIFWLWIYHTVMYRNVQYLYSKAWRKHFYEHKYAISSSLSVPSF
jgi:hypothetical protein